MKTNSDYRVILVDDDTKFGHVIQSGLKRLGYDIHYQSTLLGLEHVISDFCPNILFLDVEIGEKDSIEETKHFEEVFPSLPIIYISSHAEGSYQKRAYMRGCVAYIKKPIELDEFEAYIEIHSKPFTDETIRIGDISFTPNSREFKNIVTNNVIRLNTKDTLLFKLLAKNIEKLVTRKDVELEVWNGDIPSSYVLNNSLTRLRKILKENSNLTITTIHNTGYKLSVELK